MNGIPRDGGLVLACLVRWRVFLAVLFLLAGRYVLLPPLVQNEADTLPLARQVLVPNWLPGDWYLNQPPGYRLAFDYTAGWLVARLSFALGAALGRLLVCVLFALGVQALANALRLGARWAVLGLLTFLVVFNQSLVAGEWMVGGLEAKPFAYAFCLLALASLLRRRLAAAFFLLGLAVTFHVLVGLYATLAAGGLVLLYGRRLAVSPRRLLVAVLCWLPAAALGLWAVAEHLREPGGGGADVAARIYVHFRTPQHMLPAFWLTQGRLGLAVKGALAAVCVAGLAVVARRHPDERRRLLAAYALLGLSFFVAGLVWAARGNDRMLTFYWFRFADTVVPFAACLLLPAAVAAGLARAGFGRLAGTAALLACAAGFAQSAGITATRIAELLGPGGPERAWGLEPERVEVQFWAREHTGPRDVFLVDPLWSEFYLLAGRSPFVTYKHYPQNARAIREWYRRLAGRDADPLRETPTADPKDGFHRRFRRLRGADIRSLADAYGITHAIVAADADPFAGTPDCPPELFRNARYVVYDVRTAPAPAATYSDGGD
jgi:hypothetical protein